MIGRIFNDPGRSANVVNSQIWSVDGAASTCIGSFDFSFAPLDDSCH